MPWFKRLGRAFSPIGKVLVLIDWDNLEICLRAAFGAGKIRIDQRIKQVMDWVEKEVGGLLEGYGFVFAPGHLNEIYRGICSSNNLRTVSCPKRKTPDKNGSFDTVDETIIWFGKMMLKHPDVQFICIVSGDAHYLPLMEAAKKCGVKMAFAAPTVGSLSKQPSTLKNILRLVDVHPITKRKMFVRLDTL